MKNKIAFNFEQIASFCLILLFLIFASADMVQAQERVSNPSDKKMSAAEKIKKPKIKQSDLQKIDDKKEIPLRDENSSGAASLDAKRDEITVSDPAKNAAEETEQQSGKVKSEKLNDKNLKIVIKEDTAEYQEFDIVRQQKEQFVSVQPKVEIPTQEIIAENVRQAPMPITAEQQMPQCSFGGSLDPFIKIAPECLEMLIRQKGRDPFAKPASVEMMSGTASGFPYENYQLLTASVRRSQAGFKPLWIDWILNYSYAENVDPLLLLEVMRWESSFNPYALSPVGAGGLMQFMPATARRFNINPFDEEQAIRGGAQYLGFLLRKFNGNVLSALAGYNAGEGAVDAFLRCRTIKAGAKTINPLGRCTAHGIPPYAETQKYAHGIWANYQMSLQRAAGVADLRRRISANVRFKYSEAVGTKGLTE